VKNGNQKEEETISLIQSRNRLLKKNLLRYKVQAGMLIPFYLKKQKWGKLCEEVIHTYKNNIGLRYTELQNELENLIENNQNSTKVCKGLIELIEKKIEFQEINTKIAMTTRQKCFENLAKCIKNSKEMDFSTYTNSVSTIINEHTNILYPDIKENSIILNTPTWSGENLIDRYNLSLSRGILNHAYEVILNVSLESAQKLRAFLKYFSFSGLLFDIIKIEPAKCKIKISGPLKEFNNLNKYKARIATIVCILPQLNNFTLEAKIEIDHKKSIFKINQNNNLKSHYKAFFDYTPEEIDQFIKKINPIMEKLSCYKVNNHLPIDSQKYWAIPDYTWEYDKIVIELYIFQKYQKKMFLNFLNKFKEKTQHKTILLIDKSFDKNLLKSNNLFFLTFKDIPSSQQFIRLIKTEVI
jgi:predicted nuclease of restriction endonuclease-like RecB superfamily